MLVDKQNTQGRENALRAVTNTIVFVLGWSRIWILRPHLRFLNTTVNIYRHKDVGIVSSTPISIANQSILVWVMHDFVTEFAGVRGGLYDELLLFSSQIISF